MRVKVLIVSVLSAMFLVVGCQSEPKQNEEQKQDDRKTIEDSQLEERTDINALERGSDCEIVLETQAVMMKWTAFKFTEKTAVGGRFDQVGIDGPTKGKDWREMAMNSSFQIKTSSVNSENPERDEKISKYFFGELTDGGVIEGVITDMKGSEFEGRAAVTLVMNGTESIVLCNYMRTNNLIVLTGGIDLAEWGAEGAVNSLNEVCYDLHKGSDGVSKLWSVVDFEMQLPYGYDCPN